MKRAEPWVFVAVVVFFLYASVPFDGFIQDDAFIFARYAHNLAQGNGLVYNTGEYTEGATSLLWTLLAALADKAGVDIPFFLKIASRTSAVLWLFAFFLLCRQWLTRPWQWLPPVLLFAAFPPFVLWSQGGLEVCFFGFLATLGFYLAEANYRTPKPVYLWALSITACLLILTRPEGLPVAFLYGLYLVLYPPAGKRAGAYTVYLPATLLCLAGLLLFRYLYFGDWVPNTYYAKGGGGYYLWRYGLAKFGQFLGSHYQVVFFAAALPVLLTKERIRVPMLMVPLWAAYYIKSGGDILPEHRLLLPAVPFMFLGSFWLFHRVLAEYAEGWRARYYPVVLWVFTGLLLYGDHRYRQEDLSAFGDVTRALERAHGETGRYLDTHMRPGETALLTDAGMTAHYAPDKHIVDWLGLCDRRVARILYNTGYNPWAMFYCKDETEKEQRQKACFDALARYFDELRPRYVVLNIFLDETAEDQLDMIEYYHHTPDSLSDFVLRHVSFDGYFGIFGPGTRAKAYRPVLVSPYNPNFWLVLAERDTKLKAPQGVKGF